MRYYSTTHRSTDDEDRERKRESSKRMTMCPYMNARIQTSCNDIGRRIFFQKKIDRPRRPAKTPRRRQGQRPLAQKSPYRLPSHRTSTKPSGGRGAIGAKDRLRRRQKNDVLASVGFTPCRGGAKRHRTPPTSKAKQPCLQTQRNTSVLSHIHDTDDTNDAQSIR